MIHTISRDRAQEFQYLRQLWSHLLDPGRDLRTKLEETFSRETAELELDHAFLSRIDRQNGTHRIQVSYGTHEGIYPGKVTPLCRTFCRKTISEPANCLCIRDVRAAGLENDPAYEALGFGSYLGVTVKVDDELYGTLCFAGDDPRTDEITEREVELVAMLGQWVEYELHRWNSPVDWTANGDVAANASRPGADDVNAMMAALSKRPRRWVLVSLLDEQSADETDLISRVANSRSEQIQLRHNHLPRLQSDGYIEWDRDDDSISRGPRFDDVIPLLVWVQRNTREFSPS